MKHQPKIMVKSPAKSTVEKAKSTNARTSTSASVQRRTGITSNATRRRTIDAVINYSFYGSKKDSDADTLDNSSIPGPYSDMSGDDDDDSESSQSSSVQKRLHHEHKHLS